MHAAIPWIVPYQKRGELMRIRICFAFFCLFTMVFTAVAFAVDPIRIAVIDFQVQSHNPVYEFFGKGFAEFTAIELACSKDVVIIERERRNKAIEELVFSVSDTADESKSLRVGKLLAAQYLVTGSIFEMTGKLVVTVAVLDVEKGATVFTDRVTGDPGAYDFITASLAGKILTYFSLKTPDAVVAKVDKADVKPQEAAEKFSTAVNALDNKDTATAKTELSAAQQLDPSSDAIRIYLSKLTENNSKFKIITEPYYPLNNPAYIGVIQYDKIYAFGNSNFWGSQPNGLPFYYNPPGTDLHLDERIVLGFFGYQFPAGKNMGFDFELMLGHYTDFVCSGPVASPSAVAQASYSNIGGSVSFGWAPTSLFSCGLGVALYSQSLFTGVSASTPLIYNFRQAVSLGFLLKNPDSTIIYDFMAGFPFDKLNQVDPVTFTLKEVQAPLYIENTLTLVLSDRKIFLIAKQLNNIAFDRPYYFGRILAAAEFWLLDWLGLYATIEGSLGFMGGAFNTGFGGMLGLAFRIPSWGLDFNVTSGYRVRPSRIFGDETFADWPVYNFDISKTNLFISR
jgi:TolB-like protein